MSFDKSLKLINYAKNDNGFLELFTELDHEYSIGDKIFVVGGYLDNTAELLHTSDYSSGSPTQYSPFNDNMNGYEILAVDIINNAFTINYPVTDSTVVYPYGITLNRFGDPQDAVNNAYNTFTGDRMYKNIYVSRTCFIAGRMKKGTINNGIFGNDDNTVILNNPTATAASASGGNMSINHIASKNITISKGEINSKTDISNPITKKLYVVEDLTVDIDNPFSVYNAGVANNNSGYGYSSFESFIHSNTVSINNGDFNNPYNDKIKFTSDAVITKAKIGAPEPMYLNGCTLDDVTMLGGELNNTTHSSGVTTATDIRLNTFIPLIATGFTWSGTAGEITFNVDYNAVANRIWPTLPANVIISGIESSDLDFHVMNEGLIGTLTAVSYTFGDINSATMTFSFSGLIADWATITLEAENTFNVSGMSLAFRTTSRLLINESTIAGYLGGTFGDIYIADNNTLGAGFYNAIVMNNTNTVTGTSKAANAYLSGVYQVNTAPSTVPPMTYMINDTQYAITGQFNRTKIIKGIVYQSRITASHVIPTPGRTIYLDGCTLYEGARVESDVMWNDINIQFYGDVVSGTSINETSYLGDRVTPWKTNIFGVAPLGAGDKTLRLNKTTGSRANDISYYTTQHKIDSIGYTVAPSFDVTFEVPVIENVQVPYDDTQNMVILDHGEMETGWTMINPSANKRPIFAGPLDSNITLRDAVNARRINDLGGTETIFTGVALPPANSTQTVEVDDQWIYTLTNYPFDEEAISHRDISIDIHDPVPTVSTYPDPALNNILSLLWLKLYPDTGIEIDAVFHDIVTPTAVPDAAYEFSFRHNANFVKPGGGSASEVPVCFIETEQVIVYTKDLLDVVTGIEIINCNYCPEHGSYVSGKQYSWDYSVDPALYPADFMIKNNINNNVTFEIDSLTKKEIHVEFWITWYYEETTLTAVTENNPYITSNYSGGYRTKHVLKHTFESSGETFQIVESGTDAIVDDSGDTLIWT